LAIVLYCWSLFVILSFFSFAHCAVLLITVWHFVLFFLWPLCCIADHCLSILSLFFFAHCAVLLITVCHFVLFSLGHCAVLLITVCLFCPCFPLVIVL
jgi:hypothetical protein